MEKPSQHPREFSHVARHPGLHLAVPAVGDSGLTYPPTTATLITGERDAVLVDTQFLKGEIDAVGDMIQASGKRLTAIYITHAHGDHALGLGVLSRRFPGVKALASPSVAATLKATIDELVPVYTNFFGDEVAAAEVLPEQIEGGVIDLEGEELRVIEVGQGDIPDSTVLHIPSIDTVISGDVTYNRIHPILAELNDEMMAQWIASLDTIAALKPKLVVSGHKVKGASDADVETIVGGTRAYIQDFREAVAAATSAAALVATMSAKYPDYENPATLFISARGQFLAEGESLYGPITAG